jgi:hypothetical protein
LDLIRNGGFQLKKVDPNAPKQPLPNSNPTHLDLIKQGGFQLKKVDRSVSLPPLPKQKEKDPMELTSADLLEKMAQVRAAVAGSDSDESGSETDSSTAW